MDLIEEFVFKGIVCCVVVDDVNIVICFVMFDGKIVNMFEYFVDW